MFDVGFWEIFLIMILALVVIGPERLPGAARTVGLWVGKTRRYIEGVKSDVEDEFDISEFKRIIHNQEIQLNELKDKISEPVKIDSDESSESEKQTHSIEEETPAIEEPPEPRAYKETIASEEVSASEETATTEKAPSTKATTTGESDREGNWLNNA